MPPSNPPEGGSAPRLPRRGGSVPSTPLLRAGCVTARDKPPSCLRQGRGLHPKQAAFLPAARAESAILQLDGNTRTRGNDTHARALASGPKRDAKFFAKLSFKKAGGERSVTGAGPSGEILPGPSWTSWPPRRTPRPGASRAPSAAGQIQPFPLAARRFPRGCK